MYNTNQKIQIKPLLNGVHLLLKINDFKIAPTLGTYVCRVLQKYCQKIQDQTSNSMLILMHLKTRQMRLQRPKQLPTILLYLDISFVGVIMNAYMRAIASLYNLKSLQFKGGELTLDTRLCSIAKRRAKLQHLEIYVCDDISLQGLGYCNCLLI